MPQTHCAFVIVTNALDGLSEKDAHDRLSWDRSVKLVVNQDLERSEYWRDGELLAYQELPDPHYGYERCKSSPYWHITTGEKVHGYWGRYALCGFDTWPVRIESHSLAFGLRGDPPGTCPGCAAIADGVQQLSLLEVS